MKIDVFIDQWPGIEFVNGNPIRAVLSSSRSNLYFTPELLDSITESSSLDVANAHIGTPR
ncbi:hypothetical protein ATN84_10960 [Paramesorhizobium deserti]|uniref:Uncharacterized protein n=1 Tax=Paramesorhizobium deserti TaxID=1494590 RepID=A0A135HTQ5_9HYPH|nr:hypothetical protein ATN84_10960 [Paramesorhizobium deserti]